MYNQCCCHVLRWNPEILVLVPDALTWGPHQPDNVTGLGQAIALVTCADYGKNVDHVLKDILAVYDITHFKHIT